MKVQKKGTMKIKNQSMTIKEQVEKPLKNKLQLQERESFET
jgi:hypothetical protein